MSRVTRDEVFRGYALSQVIITQIITYQRVCLIFSSNLVAQYYKSCQQLHMANREDDLLNKLKNCIGSLKAETPLYQQELKSTPPAYNAIKQNYRNTPFTSNNYNLPSSVPNSAKNSMYLAHHHADRQPLLPSNRIPPTPNYNPQVYQQAQSSYRAELAASFNINPPSSKYEPQRFKGRAEDFRSYDSTPRKFQYNFQARRRQQKPIEAPTLPQDLFSTVSRQDFRSQISRRYSVMQSDRAAYQKPSNPQITPVKVPTAPRNYQKQVEERKEMLEGAMQCRKERAHQVSNQKKFQSYSIRKQNFTARDPGSIKPTEPALSTRKSERPLMVAQTLQRAYEEDSSNECSALTKLKKISELNEKINDRIRNIINVFEDHKR